MVYSANKTLELSHRDKGHVAISNIKRINISDLQNI